MSQKQRDISALYFAIIRRKSDVNHQENIGTKFHKQSGQYRHFILISLGEDRYFVVKRMLALYSAVLRRYRLFIVLSCTWGILAL